MPSADQNRDPTNAKGQAFATTHWSVVLAAGDSASRPCHVEAKLRRSRRFLSWLVPTLVDRDLILPGTDQVVLSRNSAQLSDCAIDSGQDLPSVP